MITRRRLLLALLVCVTILSIYELVSSVYVSQTTGILQIKPLGSGVFLTVERSGKQAVNLGRGETRVRLKPGAYQLLVTKNRNQDTKQFVIRNKSTTALSARAPVNHNKPSRADLEAIKLIDQLLPFTGPGFQYQITYTYTFNKAFSKPVIIITAPTAQDQQAAVAWIKSQGYDPSTMTIQYFTAQP